MKNNIIIDYHNFCLRSLFTYGIKEEKKMEDVINALEYSDKLYKDFENLLFYYKGLQPERYIFTGDTPSWRKKYNSDYKAKRKANSNVNWENYFKIVMPEINSVFSKYSPLHYHTDLESDDLIYYWVEKLKSKKENVIIFSSDGDLDQLVYYNEDSWCVKINLMSKKIHATKEFIDWVNSNNSVNESNSSLEKNINALFEYDFNKDFSLEKSLFYDLIKDRMSFVEINPDQYLLQKIITGDSSDNIRSAYLYNNRGIGEKSVKKYLSMYPNFKKSDLFDDSFLSDLAESIFTSKKGKVSKGEIKRGLVKNINLIFLNKKIIDKFLPGISQKVNEEIEEIIKKPQVKIPENLHEELLNATKINEEAFKTLEINSI